MAKSPYLDSFFRAFFLFSAIVLGAVSPSAGSDAGIERILLPETPPTIERAKGSPLDRPALRKQNFLDEEDDFAFPAAFPRRNFDMPRDSSPQVSISLACGSFASAGGYFMYASSEGWQLSFHGFSTEGETALFGRESNGAAWQWERSVTPDVRVHARAGADDDRLWTQQYRRMTAGGGTEWYAAPSLKLHAQALLDQGEISGDDKNTAARFEAGSQWFPREGHVLSVTASRQTNTAFERGRDIPGVEALYLLMLGHDITCGAGGRYQKDALFPEARANWHINGVLTFGVSYRPGIDTLSWNGLYGGERFIVTNAALPFPRSIYYFSETIGYYRSDRDTVELELHQAAWRDYAYWHPVAGSDALTPGTLPESYVAGGTLSVRRSGERFSPSLSIIYNSNTSLPMVPAIEIKTAAVWKPAPWTVTAGYGYIDPRAAVLNGSGVLPAAHDVSLEISRDIAPGLLLSAAGRNLLGQDIELQPGFRRKTPLLETRLTASF